MCLAGMEEGKKTHTHHFFIKKLFLNEKVYYNTTQSQILLNHLCVHLRYVLSHQHIVNY